MSVPQTEPPLTRPLRHSRPAQVTAAGFIGLILGGNLWLAYALFDRAVPAGIRWVVHGSAAVVVLGGLGLAFLACTRALAPQVEKSE